ncbi:thiamine pyrophosphate-dependent dehydrogenase E1 component subunit alpha [Catellatospora sichuanensis]|uniref:thiamine pyrophosphate-dependent dehydrogenase E1 component subunit alpha n=1 Tax=Catellatospora sichuanensis TaxID=1969805 RepID=UPI001182D8BD|nr:thiamine pyrophosphate-dependent dehydrogenase E1 component subunit alpha [Catellatospora sichuanensis]
MAVVQGVLDERLTGYARESRNERLYRRMRFIRRFEETLLSLFDQGELNGTTHACIGQEADAVAVMEHLRDGDHVFSNHRCHGHYLAQSGDAVGLLAEIMGKDAGVCRGLGGSQHICAPGFKSNGVQGGIVPAAAGIALANQLSGSDAISVVFIGDGTLGEGAVYETLNIAALWRLPLLVVCEDNAWAQSTPVSANLAGSMRHRFEAFGIPVREIDSTDVLELDDAAAEEIQELRRTGGPRVLLIHTYRLCHHSKNDDDRPAAEVEARWLVEPLVVHGKRLTDTERQAIDDSVEAAISDVVTTAKGLA